MMKYLVPLLGALCVGLCLWPAGAGEAYQKDYNCTASTRSLEETVDREVNPAKHLAILGGQMKPGEGGSFDGNTQSVQ